MKKTIVYIMPHAQRMYNVYSNKQIKLQLKGDHSLVVVGD